MSTVPYSLDLSQKGHDMRYLAILISLVVFTTGLFSTTIFDEKNHYKNTLVVCFYAESIKTNTGDIEIKKDEQGIVSINLESFDAIAKEFEFVDIERMFWVKDQDWHDTNGSYPMNIFKIIIRDNDRIEEALLALMNNKDIIWAEYNAISRLYYIPNDPMFSQQWYLPRIGAPQLWNYIKGDTTIVIGIVDSGAKWNHADLAANIFIDHDKMHGMTIHWEEGMISGSNETGTASWGQWYASDPIGWNFFPPMSNNPFQSWQGGGRNNDHGTHVAGTAGAVGDNGIGITGVAMNVKLLITKHAPINAYSNQVHNPYAGIYYCADVGAHIINCSWGGGGNANISNTAVNYATGRGSLVVAAAGNEYWSNDVNPSYPSDSPNALSVAASDMNDNKADFSNWGNAIAVTAPGVNMRSTTYSGTTANPTDSYISYSGTSMASPVVAGVAALIKSTSPWMTPHEIKDRIIWTADPMTQNEPGGQFEGKLGGGRINAFKAVMSGLIPNLTIQPNPTVTEHEGDGDGIPNIGETLSIVIRLENESDWQDATGTTAVLTSSLPGVTIQQGNLNYGTVFNGMTSTPATARVHIANSVNTTTIPLTLTVQSNQQATNPYPYTTTINFNIQLSLSRPGWPLVTDAQSISSPVIADFGDGLRLVTQSGNRVHVVDHNKVYNPGFPLDIGDNTNTQIAIGDVRGTGTPQIIIASSSGMLRVIDHLGNVLDSRNMNGIIRAAPVLADLNNSGHLSIIIATQNQNLFVLKGSDLSDMPNFPISMGSNIMVNMAVEDITGNGVKDIVLTTLNGNLHAINSLTGQPLSGFPVEGAGSSIHGVSIARLESGTGAQIIIGNSTGTNAPVKIYNHNGAMLRQTTVPTAIRTEIAIADLMQNGNQQLIFGDNMGNIHVKDKNLSYLPGFPINVGVAIESSPVFADLHNSGQLCIIFCDNDGYLHIIRPNGEYLPGYPIQVINTGIKASPWVGRFVPNSNRGDILLVVPYGIEFIDFKHYAHNFVWNSYRGNNFNTASFIDPMTSETDEVVPILSNELHQNYPNPFNPQTTISYTLKNSEFVTLMIYNIRGQLVKTITDGYRDAGSHTVIWDGVDETNTPVASGLYFYRIQTNSFSQTRKMMLLK